MPWTPGYPQIRQPHCIVWGCRQSVYAMWLCNTHWNQARTINQTTPHLIIRCRVPQCKTLIKFSKRNLQQLCTAHLYKRLERIRKGLPANAESLAISFRKGIYNVHWNGGTSQYPDHNTLKKHRLIILKQSNSLCRCGRRAYIVHHKNHNTADHRLENLEAICGKCHSQHHASTPRRSKFVIRFGKTLKAFAKEYGVTESSIWNRIRRGWIPGQPYLKRIGRPRLDSVETNGTRKEQ